MPKPRRLKKPAGEIPKWRIRTYERPRKVRRGSIAGLLSARFIAQMCGLSLSYTKRIFYKELKEQGYKVKQLSPRDIGRFVVFMDSLKTGREHKQFEKAVLSNIRPV